MVCVCVFFPSTSTSLSSSCCAQAKMKHLTVSIEEEEEKKNQQPHHKKAMLFNICIKVHINSHAESAFHSTTTVECNVDGYVRSQQSTKVRKLLSGNISWSFFLFLCRFTKSLSIYYQVMDNNFSMPLFSCAIS